MARSDLPEEYGDLAPFVVVVREEDAHKGHTGLDRYDPEIDIPLPRKHSEVIRAKAAKFASERRRVELYSSEVNVNRKRGDVAAAPAMATCVKRLDLWCACSTPEQQDQAAEDCARTQDNRKCLGVG